MKLITTKNGVNICCANVCESEVCITDLSEYRKSRLSRVKSDKVKKQSVAAEAVLISAMRHIMPDISLPLGITADENGKPYFTDNTGIEFSLSHSGDFAAAAVADAAVGIDIQEIKKAKPGIAEKYFTANELLANDGGDEWFFRIWARKEAVAKAEGTGISIGLEKIDVSSNNVILNGEKYYVEDIATQDKNYCMAVAIKLI